jgi:hypothetical protein
VSRGYGRGPLQSYEITWMSGHVETIQAHQVDLPQRSAFLAHDALGVTAATDDRSRVEVHAEIDGRWLLVLFAPEKDIRTIRLVTGGEPVPERAS